MKRGFRSYHPFVCFLYYVCVLTMIILYQHPFFLLFASIILIIFNFILDRGKALKQWIGMIVFLSLLLFIFTPLFNHRGSHILFYLNDQPVTLESVILGLIHSLTLICIITLFITFNQVITADKFLFLFAKWFPQWALLTMLSMRFVPLFRRRLQEIMIVQKARGTNLGKGTIRERIKNRLLILQILFIFSLENGIQTADSMNARGYGLGKRSRYNPYQMRKVDWISVFILLIISSVALVGWWLEDGVLSIIPILEPILLEGREWSFLIVFLLLIGFPLGTEIREEILWQYWKRKI